MKPEGWKGAEALSAAETTAFWQIVSTPASPEEIEAVEVGQSVYIEANKLRMIGIVREKWVNEAGLIQIRFSLPELGEKYDPPIITIVTGSRS